ncbi:hypothetical protein [Paenibacillus roseipurpureus]|uniref:Uncharacterized protein n=1 Tax=Paenibacillus roseopurpureus TaxID=2918901 RepID=A0AA96LS06_9BACL|nr:hypothetical protein [Paenibacillus sp. MBLB1832]WNR43660.1 hypothetical protein MJB10_21545 [Paenibacillus sp. MBLB1832]
MKYDKETISAFSKNPLGIISLFLFMIYGVAALVVGTGSFDVFSQRLLIFFIVIYPLIVLAVFVKLVISHHAKLYAPTDYRDDSNFLKVIQNPMHNYFEEIERKRNNVISDVVMTIRDEKSIDKMKNEITRAFIKSMVITNIPSILFAIAHSINNNTKIAPDPEFGHPQLIVKDEVIATYVSKYLIKELEDLHNKGIINLQNTDPIYFRVTDFAKPFIMEIAMELRENERNIFERLIEKVQ